MQRMQVRYRGEPNDEQTHKLHKQHQNADIRQQDTDAISRRRETKRRIVAAAASAVLMKAVSVFRKRATADTGLNYLISACGRCRHFRLLLIDPRRYPRHRSA